MQTVETSHENSVGFRTEQDGATKYIGRSVGAQGASGLRAPTLQIREAVFLNLASRDV